MYWLTQAAIRAVDVSQSSSGVASSPHEPQPRHSFKSGPSSLTVDELALLTLGYWPSLAELFAKMATNQSHHILHRMVPLICQALTTSPNDDVVWLEGLRLLCDPKLHTIMNLTPSIWLPLLLKGIDPARSPQIIAASLRALTEMAGTLEPMKSCLIKPLKALARHSDPAVATSEELIMTVEKLNLKITDHAKKIIGREVSKTVVQFSIDCTT